MVTLESLADQDVTSKFFFNAVVNLQETGFVKNEGNKSCWRCNAEIQKVKRKIPENLKHLFRSYIRFSKKENGDHWGVILRG